LPGSNGGGAAAAVPQVYVIIIYRTSVTEIANRNQDARVCQRRTRSLMWPPNMRTMLNYNIVAIRRKWQEKQCCLSSDEFFRDDMLALIFNLSVG